jgi:hypothetical protein
MSKRGAMAAERFHNAWKDSYLQGGFYNQQVPAYGHGYPGQFGYGGFGGYGYPGYGYSGNGFPGIGNGGPWKNQGAGWNGSGHGHDNGGHNNDHGLPGDWN